MKQNKFLFLSFIAVFIILFVFSAPQIPISHPKNASLPVALVVEDSQAGATQFAHQIQTKATQFEWVKVNSQKELKSLFESQAIYGAVIIPKDFSKQMASLQTASPIPTQIKFVVNEGKNVTIANNLTQGFQAMGLQLNQVISQQLFAQMKQKNIQLTAQQAQLFAQPIQSTLSKVNEVGSLKTAPLSFFQPVWMASLIGAVLLFFSSKNRSFKSTKQAIGFRFIQIGISCLLGLVIGFSVLWFSTWMLDYSIQHFSVAALFLSLASSAFILLILACMSWIGFAALPIFVLLMFFGLPLLQLAPEMLPSFYADWIMPWLPFQFLFDGLREILFFNGSFWNESTVTLTWIGIIAALFILSKSFLNKTV